MTLFVRLFILGAILSIFSCTQSTEPQQPHVTFSDTKEDLPSCTESHSGRMYMTLDDSTLWMCIGNGYQIISSSVPDTIVRKDTIFVNSPFKPDSVDTIILRDSIFNYDTTTIFDTLVIRDSIFSYDTVVVRDSVFRSSDTLVLFDTTVIKDTLIRFDSTFVSADTIFLIDTVFSFDTVVVKDTLVQIDSLIVRDTLVVTYSLSVKMHVQLGQIDTAQENIRWENGVWIIEFTDNLILRENWGHQFYFRTCGSCVFNESGLLRELYSVGAPNWSSIGVTISDIQKELDGIFYKFVLFEPTE